MTFQLTTENLLNEEDQKRRENITEMAILIIEEMKKRGLKPKDTSSLLGEIENQMYQSVKQVWAEKEES